MMLSTDDLPMFFDTPHAALADVLRTVATQLEKVERAEMDEPARDHAVVGVLARHGLFELVAGESIESRSLCLAREMLGYVSPRADSIFAVQGLGVHPIVLAGSAEQRAQLPAFARGASIAAFALTEPDAGSDVAAIATRAEATADGYRLDGDK